MTGPLDTPDSTPDSDSSCSSATIKSYPPPTNPEETATVSDALTFTRDPIGRYVTDTDPVASGVTRWVIANIAPRRWEITSFTDSGERRRHGAAYTLREAKEAVSQFHRSNVEHRAGAVTA